MINENLVGRTTDWITFQYAHNPPHRPKRAIGTKQIVAQRAEQTPTWTLEKRIVKWIMDKEFLHQNSPSSFDDIVASAK
jgi:hypothetical protein